MYAAQRLEFAPPPTAGLLRALGLAILAHLLLVAALTWGVQWKRDAPTVTAQAELWSALPQLAAPKRVDATPAPPQPPAPAPQAAAPIAPDADIALEREKRRLKKEQREAAQKQQADARREKLEKRDQLEKDKGEQVKLAQEKKRERDEKLALEKKKAEQEAMRKQTLQAQQEAQKLEAQRQANLQRIAGLAGSAGAPSASGSALQSSGPSASYGGRVSAKVRPNIVFIEEPVGNPTAVVEVRAAPDGTIVSRKLLKTSGYKSWDEAVLKAIDKTEVLPRDVDGRVPSVLEISFRPKD